MRNNSDEKLRFIEWLGFTRNPDLTNARWLGYVLGFIFSLIAFNLLIAAIVTLFDFFQAIFRIEPYGADVDGAAIRNIGLVLAALLGIPFIIWRSFVAAKQARIADESLFNEKINTAAESLSARRQASRIVEETGKSHVLIEWEDDLVTRAAAIDRLEGLVVERNEVAPRIARLLASYIRGNFSCTNLDITEPPFDRKTPRMDLQKAVDTVGKVYKIAAEVDQSHWRLDLKACDFDGVSFLNGYFRAADFSGSRMEACIFNDGNFEGCLFRNSLLNFSDYRKTNLKGARFDRAIINRPKPSFGGFTRSVNLGTLTGATFIAADISALSYLGNKNVISKTFGTKDTKLSAIIKDQMLSASEHSRAHTLKSVKDSENLSAEDLERIQRLEETGFHNWSPYDSNDMVTGWILEEFLNDLGMKNWPYIG